MHLFIFVQKKWHLLFRWEDCVDPHTQGADDSKCGKDLVGATENNDIANYPGGGKESYMSTKGFGKHAAGG